MLNITSPINQYLQRHKTFKVSFTIIDSQMPAVIVIILTLIVMTSEPTRFRTWTGGTAGVCTVDIDVRLKKRAA